MTAPAERPLTGRARCVVWLPVERRPAEPGEMCSCGRPAIVVYLDEHGGVRYCGVPRRRAAR